jgi:capsular polysaccharide transport system ATP-binding protein
MIRVANLTKSYVYQGKRVTVLKDVNFTIETGQSVAVLGANGAGKSTLLRLLGGIDIPDCGTIETDCNVSWPVGLAGGFQGSLTGRENVTFVCRIYADRADLDRKIRLVEDFAELGLYFDRPFKTYSSGMRSRLAFGLSMAFDFDVYLIDEVTSAGDQRFREKSKELLLERRQKADFLMVDHNLWGLKFHCDRAFLLEEGRIREFDDLQEAIEVHRQSLLVPGQAPPPAPGKKGVKKSKRPPAEAAQSADAVDAAQALS